MIVAIHQPAYLPWLGYLERIAAADTFVFLDTVQFEKNSFTNRNRIKSATGPIWLTVPVRQHGHMSKTLLDLEIDNSKNWRKKHLQSVEQNYRRAPGFATGFQKLVELFANQDSQLAELCFRQLRFWLDELGIKTRLVRSSSLQTDRHGSDLVLDLCTQLGATTYISGPLGRDYLEIETFDAAGIEVIFQKFVHPSYPQLYGEFVPAMAVVDYWMNCPDTSPFRGGAIV